MLANRLQSTSSLLFQNQFNFATKNLKQIKIRMKAVESIKKITKVYKKSHRQWRWWLHLRWSKMSVDLKELKIMELVQFKELYKTKLILLRRNPILLQRNGCLCLLPLIKVYAVESTQTLSEKSKLWLKQTEMPINYS